MNGSFTKKTISLNIYFLRKKSSRYRTILWGKIRIVFFYQKISVSYEEIKKGPGQMVVPWNFESKLFIKVDTFVCRGKNS